MWILLLSIAALFLTAVGIFLTAHDQRLVVSAGLIATACLMVALGILPLGLQLMLLLTILLGEQWCLHYKPVAEE